MTKKEDKDSNEDWKTSYKKILEKTNTNEKCPKCGTYYFEHVGTGREWMCPIKDNDSEKNCRKISTCDRIVKGIVIDCDHCNDFKPKESTPTKEELKDKSEAERYRILEECGLITRTKEEVDHENIDKVTYKKWDRLVFGDTVDGKKPLKKYVVDKDGTTLYETGDKSKEKIKISTGWDCWICGKLIFADTLHRKRNFHNECWDKYLLVKKEDLETSPKQIHEWYLEAIKNLNPKSFNQEANKPYEELTEEQKFIDKFLSKKIKEKFIQEGDSNN